MRRPAVPILAALLHFIATAPGYAAGAAPPQPPRRIAVSDLSLAAFPDPLTPPALQKIRLHRYDAGDARTPPARVALLLLPCSACGTGWLDPLARDLTSRGGVEVFTMERRGMMLEERDMMDRLRNDARASAPEVIAYYLGGAGKNAAWSRPDGRSFPFLLMWGLRLLHEDMRLAIGEVKRLTGLPVVLGGFSGGASEALGFAARRFDDGRSGHEEIAGVVLLDGGLLWADEAMHEKIKQGADAYLDGFDLSQGFWDMRDDQIRAEIGAALALEDTDSRSPLAEGVVPAEVGGPGMTNRAFFGWSLDLGKPPQRGRLGSLYQLQMGALEPPPSPGRLTGWTDGGREGEPTRLAQVAAIARAPGGIFDWYHSAWLVKESFTLFLDAYDHPDGGISEIDKISAPVFSVVSDSARVFGPDLPPLSGTWLFARIPAKGSQSISVPGLAHADILVSDAARERVFAPLHRWLMTVAPPPGRPDPPKPETGRIVPPPGR
jgi:hypothetical protein